MLTGQRFNGAPLCIAEHQTDVPWLLNLLEGNTPAHTKKNRKKAVLAATQEVVEGDRYHFLQSSAAQLAAKGLTAPEILSALQSINALRCKPPKAESVLRELAEWAGTLTPGQHPSDDADKAKQTKAVDLLSFPFTDSGNAERIAAVYGTDIRYCHGMRKWFVWDGARWEPDSSKKVNYYAKETARLLFAQAQSLPDEQKKQLEYRQTIERHARKSESAKARRDRWTVYQPSRRGFPFKNPS